jgi:multicomponent Na+:H+ antiporter subunit G
MAEPITVLLMILGAFFMVVAGLGVLRMPDLFLRMSASTKASTLGAGALLLAVAVHFDNVGITARAVATIVFLMLTTPIAAHLLGRAGYFVGVKLVETTVIDELAGQYDLRSHRLRSRQPAPTPQETSQPDG